MIIPSVALLRIGTCFQFKHKGCATDFQKPINPNLPKLSGFHQASRTVSEFAVFGDLGGI
jgi:hypothetical protein